jgi:hypothetical protein
MAIALGNVRFWTQSALLTLRSLNPTTDGLYVGEKVSDFTQPIRSSAGYVDQCLVSSSRVRCSLARQLFTLSSGVWLYAKPAARQLAVRSQLGTLSARRHWSDAPRRRLDKTRCRVRKRSRWQ